MKRLIIIFLLSSVALTLKGQQLPDRKKRADALYKSGSYALAIPIYRSLIKLKGDMVVSGSVENVNLLADCFRETKSYIESEYWYSLTIAMENAPSMAHYHYGEALQHNGKYKEAKEQFLNFNPSNEQEEYFKRSKITSCDKSLGLSKNSFSYEVKDIRELNSKFSDFGFIVNHNDFFFVSNRSASYTRTLGKNKDSLYSWTNEPFWHIFECHPDKQSNFTVPEILGNTINSKYHTGPAVLNKEGDIMFFTQANAKKFRENISKAGNQYPISSNNNQIFVSIKLDGQWQKPLLCSFNHLSKYSCEHPALSQDEKTLYFASDMPGGKGGMDLYSVDILGGGLFSVPKNLGDSINSPGDEVFPTVGPDGNLYFSSDGRIGYGGLDIFRTSLKNNHWTAPFNMGKPINSDKDDFFMEFTNNENTDGFLSSNRDGGMGEDDIYSVHGISSNFFMDTNLSSYKYLKKNNPSCIDSLKKFLKIDASNGWKGRNLISYDLSYLPGNSDLKKSTTPFLNLLIDFMLKNEKVRISIQGFAEFNGSASKSLLLSASRASKIKDYFLSYGIDPSRVLTEGMGNKSLKLPCSSTINCADKQRIGYQKTIFTLQ